VRRNLAVAALLGALGAIHMSGWLDPELLPPDDFAGYVAVAEDTRDQLLRYGEIPAWNPKWFAGTTQYMSHFKERLMLPWVLLFGGLRGTQLSIYLIQVAAGLAMFAGFTRYLGAPGVGLVCGYAYAFSTFSSYSTEKVDAVFSALLFPLIFAAALEMLRRRRARFAVALGVLTACAFSTNLIHALIVPPTVLLLALLRPWPRPANEAFHTPGRLLPRQLALRWAGLTSLALAIFSLFAASQIAWFALDQKHHSPHDPEYVDQAIHYYSEQSPYSLVNRAEWLGRWLESRGVQYVERAPEDPLRGQRRYLGWIALAICAGGCLAARRDRTLRRSYQLFALLFLIQWNVATGPVSLARQLARPFRATLDVESSIAPWLAAAAVVCGVWAVARWQRGGRRWTSEIELPVGLGLFCALMAVPIFPLLRASLPFFAHFRAPGMYMALLPFCFYAMFGLGLVAIVRKLPPGRTANGFLCAVLALCVLDFWSGRMAFTRGTSFEPVREARAWVAALPGGDGVGRIAMGAFENPTIWNHSSLVIANSALDSSWGWQTSQANEAAQPYFEISWMWLLYDLPPRQHERHRAVGHVLGQIGRYRYLLDEFRETDGVDLGAPWRPIARNERFALWEQPDVAPMAYAYRAYDVTLGIAPLREAFAIGGAHPRGIATIAGDALPTGVLAGLLADSARVIRLADEGRRGPASSRDSAIAKRFADKFVDLGARDSRARVQDIYRDRSARALVPVLYRRVAPDHMQLEIDAGAEPAVVLVSEAHHPWWRAAVDGEAAPLLEANMLFMAVRVGPGVHEVELRLEPPWIVAAADRITALCWLVLVAVGCAHGVRALLRRRAQRT
jgi:hypothetical protein